MLRIIVILTEPRRVNENHLGYLMFQSTRNWWRRGTNSLKGVCVLGPFVTYRAGDLMGSGLSAKERERENYFRTPVQGRYLRERIG